MIDTIYINHNLFLINISTTLLITSLLNEHKFPFLFKVYLLSGSYSIGLPYKSVNYPPKADIIDYPEQVSHR